MRISAAIKQLRAEQGVSQAWLAHAARLSLTGLKNIEAGTSIPRLDTTIAILSALNHEVRINGIQLSDTVDV